MARAARPGPAPSPAEVRDLADRYRTEQRRQLFVLSVVAAIILIVSVIVAGVGNVFLPGWWRIDLP